jgi:hypothetical protein
MSRPWRVRGPRSRLLPQLFAARIPRILLRLAWPALLLEKQYQRIFTGLPIRPNQPHTKGSS